jgi:hypothetical protein
MRESLILELHSGHLVGSQGVQQGQSVWLPPTCAGLESCHMFLLWIQWEGDNQYSQCLIPSMDQRPSVTSLISLPGTLKGGINSISFTGEETPAQRGQVADDDHVGSRQQYLLLLPTAVQLCLYHSPSLGLWVLLIRWKPHLLSLRIWWDQSKITGEKRPLLQAPDEWERTEGQVQVLNLAKTKTINSYASVDPNVNHIIMGLAASLLGVTYRAQNQRPGP